MFKSTTKAAWSEAGCMGFVILGKCSKRSPFFPPHACAYQKLDLSRHPKVCDSLLRRYVGQPARVTLVAFSKSLAVR